MIDSIVTTVKCDNPSCEALVVVPMGSETWERGVDRIIREQRGWTCEDGFHFCCRSCRNITLEKK